MALNDILSQLGLGGSKDIVYLSVTPSVGLELIQLDINSRTVKTYTYRNLEYNESLREIGSIEDFKLAVTDMFSELKINMKNSNVVMNLPMVFLGSKELPILLADDAVTEALTSEVEQSYIFKRYEPVISWCDASNIQSGDSRKLFYSAIQKNVVDDLKNALTELGINLVGIEISLTSMLKALAFTGLANEQMKDNVSWNLMLITQNGYAICSMVGKNIVEYYEEPLAIKSFEGDEIYNAINASAQITLMSYPANYLYIVSTTDMVSAELLSKRMNVTGIINYYDNNDFKRDNPIPVSLEVLEDNAHKISLEAIGVAAGSSVNMPVKFNFLTTSSDLSVDNPNEPVHVVLGSHEFDISPNAARNISVLISLLLVLPVLAVYFVVPMIQKQKQAQLDEINSKLEQTNNEIKRIQEEQNRLNDFDANAEIKKVLGYNRDKLIGYTALGESVPKNVWITYFVAQADGKFDIKGGSENVEDVYTFYRNMKDYLINTKLRLHKLEMKTNSVDEAVTIDPNMPTDYEFEITNMSDAEVNALTKTDDQDDTKNGNNKKGAKTKSKSKK